MLDPSLITIVLVLCFLYDIQYLTGKGKQFKIHIYVGDRERRKVINQCIFYSCR